MHVGLKWRQLTLTQLETQPRPRPAARLQKLDVMRRPAMVLTTRPRTICQCHASVLAPSPGQLETPWTFGYRDIIYLRCTGLGCLDVPPSGAAGPRGRRCDMIYTGLKDNADPTREVCLRVPRRVLRWFR